MLRVLGRADGSVTAIYNRYGYVKEMREVLEHCSPCMNSDLQRELLPPFQMDGDVSTEEGPAHWLYRRNCSVKVFVAVHARLSDGTYFTISRLSHVPQRNGRPLQQL
jgi:hypothetical protein